MSCYNSIIVNAPLDEVWKCICNFHDLSWGEGVITKVEAIGELGGDQVGAKRILNEAFHETLTEIDESQHSFAYSIDDGPEPVSSSSVSNYLGRVRLLTVTENDSTFVEWTSTYESNDPNAVAAFCNPIYSALLKALQNRFS